MTVLLVALSDSSLCVARVESFSGPVSGPNDMYSSAQVAGSPLSVDLAGRGYVEEEYFVTGTARVFKRDGAVLTAGEGSLPYTTRVVVRRPASPEKFSGILHFEAAHPAQGSTSHWLLGHELMLARGDAYVFAGLGDDERQRELTREGPWPTSQTGVLAWYNPERYAALNWPEDDGIRYEVMADVIGFLRSGDSANPFKSKPPSRVIASGWSFTGSLLRSFVNYGFHDLFRLPDGSPLVDGYLVGISSRWNGGGLLPLTSAVPAPGVDDPIRELREIDVPVVEFLTEFEVNSGNGPQRADGDAPGKQHRLYELGAAVHGDQLLMDQGGDSLNRPNIVQLAAHGYPVEQIKGQLASETCPIPVSDVPMGPLARAVLNNLVLWVTENTPPPRSQPLQLGGDARVARDEDGNPIGGLPVPDVIVPVAAHGAYSGDDQPGCGLSGSRPLILKMVYPADQLRQRYGSMENYLGRYDTIVDGLVTDRWILEADAAGMKRSARREAREDFAGFGNYATAETYPETVTQSFFITMRDGVRLAIGLDRPARDGKPVEGRFPVIWHHALTISREMRDGTGGLISAMRAMPLLAHQGYVVAQVARRGNGQSFGVRRGYHDRNEAEDAYEVTQWLARQPWSTGDVGIYGCSNTGDAAMHAISVRPPALKAVFAGCFSWNKFDAFRRGGVFAQWGTGPMRTVEDDVALPAVDGDEDKVLLRQAAEEHQMSTPLLNMWQSLPFRDSWSPLVGSRFWAEGSASSYMDQIQRSGVALYVLGGWQDELRDQGLITWLNIPGTRVIIGPWKHCLNGDFPLLGEMQRFFDYHLKGMQNGLADDPSIHYFVRTGLDSGEWRSTSTWPLPDTDPEQLFLSDGALSAKQKGKSRVDLKVVIDTECPGEVIGPYSQPCASHASSATYAGAPLARRTEVTGYPIINIWMSSNAEDANIFAYLEDLAPDGTVTVVTEGRLKASLRKEDTAPWRMPDSVPWHRAFAEDQELLQPGTPVQLTFDLMPTSWVFEAGHRIRITLTGSDYRERLRQPPETEQIIIFYSSRQQPSWISLPFIAGTR